MISPRARDIVLSMSDLQGHIITFLDPLDVIAYQATSKTIQEVVRQLFRESMSQSWRMQLFPLNCKIEHFLRKNAVDPLFSEIAIDKTLLPAPTLLLTKEEFQTKTIQAWVDGYQGMLTVGERAILASWIGYLLCGHPKPSGGLFPQLLELLIDQDRPDFLETVLSDFVARIAQEKSLVQHFIDMEKPLFENSKAIEDVEAHRAILEDQIFQFCLKTAHLDTNRLNLLQAEREELKQKCNDLIQKREELQNAREALRDKNKQLARRSIDYAICKQYRPLYELLRTFWSSVLQLQRLAYGFINSSLGVMELICDEGRYELGNVDELHAEAMRLEDAHGQNPDDHDIREQMHRAQERHARAWNNRDIHAQRVNDLVARRLWTLSARAAPKDATAFAALLVLWKKEPKSFKEEKALLLNPSALKNRTQSIDFLFRTATAEQIAQCVEENPWLIRKVIENGHLFDCVRAISEQGLQAIILELPRLAGKISLKVVEQNAMGVVTPNDLEKFLRLRWPLLVPMLKQQCDLLILTLDIELDRPLCEQILQFYIDNKLTPLIEVLMKLYTMSWFLNEPKFGQRWSAQFVDQELASINAMNKRHRSQVIAAYIDLKPNLSESDCVKIFSADCSLPHLFVESMLTMAHSEKVRGLALLHWQGVPSIEGAPHIFSMETKIATAFTNGLQVPAADLEAALLQTANEGTDLLDKWLVFSEAPDYGLQERHAGAEKGFEYCMTQRMWALLSSSQLTGEMVGKLLVQLTNRVKEKKLFELVEAIAAHARSRELQIPLEDLLNILKNYPFDGFGDKGNKIVGHLVKVLRTLEIDRAYFDPALLQGLAWLDGSGGISVVKALIQVIIVKKAPLSIDAITEVLRNKLALPLTEEAGCLLRAQTLETIEAVFEESATDVVVFEKLWAAYNGKKTLPISAPLMSKLFSAALLSRPQLAVEILEGFDAPILSQIQIEEFINFAKKVTRNDLVNMLQKIKIDGEFEVKANNTANALFQSVTDADRKWFFAQASIQKQEGLTSFVLKVEQKIKAYEASWATLSSFELLCYWFYRILNAIAVNIACLIYSCFQLKGTQED